VLCLAGTGKSVGVHHYAACLRRSGAQTKTRDLPNGCKGTNMTKETAYRRIAMEAACVATLTQGLGLRASKLLEAAP
jgi:hypothetical protein